MINLELCSLVGHVRDSNVTLTSYGNLLLSIKDNMLASDRGIRDFSKNPKMCV